MIRLFSSMLFCAAICAGLCGCMGLDYGRIVGAGTNLLKAGTVSDGEVRALSVRMRAQQDSQSNVAPESSKYVKRLNRLMADIKSVNGVPINYKVYMTPEINANASPDGSVRVYSGLMDKMDDDELRFVIGHEIGHVAEGHAVNAMRMAYATEAAKLAVGAIHPTAATITDSQLGSLANGFLNAQYSQSQESAADRYSMEYLKSHHYNTMAAGSALRKLGGGGGGFFDSHPNPLKRAQVMDQLARGEVSAKKESTATDNNGMF